LDFSIDFAYGPYTCSATALPVIKKGVCYILFTDSRAFSHSLNGSSDSVNGDLQFLWG